MIVVVMGATGSGKSTIGPLLAASLRCSFLDGDELHTAAAVEKMAGGIPLTDTDRMPWLAAIHARLLDAHRRNQSLVVACSALSQSHRTAIAGDLPVAWVYLKGDASLIESRLQSRTGHFMKHSMLASQLEALQEPTGAIIVDISQSPAAIAEQVMAELRRRQPQHWRTDQGS